MSAQSELLRILKNISPSQSQFPKVRIGSCGDGGYVLPDDLAGISSVVSLGVGGEVSFDAHFARQGIPIYQYDPTVEGPPLAHELFKFHKTAWDYKDDAGSVCLESIVHEHGLNKDNHGILKFDIEGGEWRALHTTSPETLKLFRIIACELHGLNSMGNAEFLKEVRQTLELLTHSHTAVHLHANNCCGMTLIEGVPVPAVVEVTFLRNDRSDFYPSTDPIPGPLDYPNMADRPDLVLAPFA